MSTRANIEPYDGWEVEDKMGKWTNWKKGAILYHHCDGYPSWMGPELESKLRAAKGELKKAGYPDWWDSERVGALIVNLWRVSLGPKDGESEIQCFRVTWDWEKNQVKCLKEVDWSRAVLLL